MITSAGVCRVREAHCARSWIKRDQRRCQMNTSIAAFVSDVTDALMSVSTSLVSPAVPRIGDEMFSCAAFARPVCQSCWTVVDVVSIGRILTLSAISLYLLYVHLWSTCLPLSSLILLLYPAGHQQEHAPVWAWSHSRFLPVQKEFCCLIKSVMVGFSKVPEGNLGFNMCCINTVKMYWTAHYHNCIAIFDNICSSCGSSGNRSSIWMSIFQAIWSLFLFYYIFLRSMKFISI